jgi:hypothetical protein
MGSAGGCLGRLGPPLVVVVFYISGHGFGHASRDIEVINALASLRPDARIAVRTSVPRWFFDVAARAPIDFQPAEIDTGVVQIDGLNLDEDETARRAARFYADFDRRVSEEAAWLKSTGATIVVGDIPPLAFPAAARAGLPSIAMANFTWDWIYGFYPQFETLAPGVLALIGRAYTSATRALRMPLHGGFQSIPSKVRDIPLIARRSQLGREEARRALGITDDLPVILPSFGAYGAGLTYDQIAREIPFTLLVTDHEMPEARSAPRLKRVTRQQMTALNLRYEDLVAASDIVVTKPGYGIVAECIANGSALLFTSRGRFIEQEMFLREMPRVLRCQFLPQEDLLAGRWTDAVTALLQQPAAPVSMATNGAEIAASDILR